jgi:colanic acid/amylovoran biosynthesis protein
MSSKENSQSTTILLIHFHSMQNAGDSAQLEAAILNLRQHFHQPRIWVATNHPSERELHDLCDKVFPSISSLVGIDGEKSRPVKIINFMKALFYLLLAFLSRKRTSNSDSSSHNWKASFDAYRKADLVISVPGNIFFTMGRIGFPFLCSSLAVLPARIYKKPFYVLPQSIGPLKRRWERWILKELYQRANIIYLREPISYRLAEKLKFPMNRVQLALDQTIKTSKFDDEEIPNLLQELDFTTARISMGVTVIPRMVKSLPQSTMDLYYQALAGTLTYFVLKHKMAIYFLPQVTGPAPHEDDRKAFMEVTSLMSCPSGYIKIIDEHLNHNTLGRLYQKMDLFLASRLHSGLFAMSYGIPTLMIGYLTKTKGIMEMLDLQEWELDIDKLDQHLLTIKLEALWQQRIYVSSQLRQRLSEALKRTPNPGLEIASDFYYGLR